MQDAGRVQRRSPVGVFGKHSTKLTADTDALRTAIQQVVPETIKLDFDVANAPNLAAITDKLAATLLQSVATALPQTITVKPEVTVTPVITVEQ